MIKYLLLVLVLASSVFAQTKPLIMKHADSLSVARKTGYMLLKGHVHFIHDSVAFKTMRATWNRNSDIVQCEGTFQFTHPDGFIKANSGLYQKAIDQASATGNVHAADSAKTYAFFGERLIYDRKNGILTMPSKPLLHQYSKDKKGKIDTVAIKAKSITYRRNDEYAEAFDSVVVTQSGMVVTCDTGYFDKKNSWLAMTGHPKCELENHELSGDSIFLKLTPDGKGIVSALVIRNAHGVQIDPGKGRKPGSHTEAFGDTLYAEFDGQKLKRLYVNLNARGFFFEDDLPDYQNLMEGGRLDLEFTDGKMKLATVSGSAQSTYFYVKNDRTVSGKNLASGDTIFLEFNPRKNAVKKLKVRGGGALASGRYIDLERSRMHASQKKDSTSTETKAVKPKGTEVTDGKSGANNSH